MNMSKVITALKTQLGLYEVTLPFKDPITKSTVPTESVLHEVISNVTIPEYSQFVPWKRKGLAHMNSLNCIDDKYGIYELPRFLTLTPVMWIIKIGVSFTNTRGSYGDIAPAYGINRSVQGVVTSQAYMMVAGQMRSEPTAEYLGHNQVQLYGYPKCILEFNLACEHDSNGETIKDSCYDSFMELATLDVEMFLYNTLKYYNKLPTAFGIVELGMEELQGAKEARINLLNDWRDRSHLDVDNIRFM